MIHESVHPPYSGSKHYAAADNIYQFFFENARQGIFRTTPDAKHVLWANPAMIKMTGYHEFDDFQKNFSNITGTFSAYPEKRDQYTQELFHKNILHGVDVPFAHQCGHQIWCLLFVQLVRDQKNEPLYLEICAIDITRRKNEENELKRKVDEMFLETLHATPYPMAISTLNEGRFLEVNDYFLDCLGYRREEVVGKTTVDLDVYADPHFREVLYKAATQTGALRNIMVELKHKQGQVCCGTMTVRIIEIKNEPYILTMFHDETDRIRIEKELSQYRGRLENLVHERTAELTEVNRQWEMELKARRKTEQKLRAREEELSNTNAALKVLLQQRQTDKDEMEEAVLANIKTVVMPHLERLKNSPLKKDQAEHVSALEEAIADIASHFVKDLSSDYLSLSPTEIQVAAMIRDGLSSKQIAQSLGISIFTVTTHRYHLRKKMGLTGNYKNLRAYLKDLK